MVNDGAIPFAMAPLVALENPDDFHISDMIVLKIDLRIYWICDQKPVTKAIDLNGESVVLITSFEYSGMRNYVEDPNNKIEVAVEVDNHRRALAALSKGRAKYMLGYRQPVDLMQLDMAIQNLHSYPMLQTDVHLFINKSVLNSRHIMDKLERAYAKLYLQPLETSVVN
jgi:polar amino acid transport system substrate-binding protein